MEKKVMISTHPSSSAARKINKVIYRQIGNQLETSRTGGVCAHLSGQVRDVGRLRRGVGTLPGDTAWGHGDPSRCSEPGLPAGVPVALANPEALSPAGGPVAVASGVPRRWPGGCRSPDTPLWSRLSLSPCPRGLCAGSAARVPRGWLCQAVSPRVPARLSCAPPPAVGTARPPARRARPSRSERLLPSLGRAAGSALPALPSCLLAPRCYLTLKNTEKKNYFKNIFILKNISFLKKK